MRTIEFRGKDRHGEWIYGGYSEYYGCPRICFDMVDGEEYERVNEVTVGQYIGIKAENDNMIFEHDILRCIDSSTNEQIQGCVEFRNGSFCIVDAKETVHYSWIDYEGLEILGNIHDGVDNDS